MQRFVYFFILSVLVILLMASHLQVQAKIGASCTTHSECKDASTGKPACSEICEQKKCVGGVNPACYPTLPADVISIQTWIDVIAKWVGVVAGAMSVGGVIFAGIYYITAGGSQDRQKKAKVILKYSLAGGVLIIMAWGIVKFISNILSGNVPQPPSL